MESRVDQREIQSEEKPVVLIVDDEQGLAELYGTWLRDDYNVRTAYYGEEALQSLDESVSVVLLDRRMPGLSGDEVLDQIRNLDYRCPVAIVSAVEPDFDLLEMGFDEYVSKPVSKADLRKTVERMVRLSKYDQAIREYYALISKKIALDAKLSPMELESSEEYAALTTEIEERRDQLHAELEDLGEVDFNRLFQRISR